MSNVIPFPRRVEGSHRHRQRRADRRGFARGGRRSHDTAGHAPLVLLVDRDRDTNARCEAILAKLHFAVAPTRTMEEARKVMDSLRPNIIIANLVEAAALRKSHASDLPVVILSVEVMDPATLVDEIRRELRGRSRRA